MTDPVDTPTPDDDGTTPMPFTEGERASMKKAFNREREWRIAAERQVTELERTVEACMRVADAPVWGPCGTCGLPMVRNPHPDAGKPDMDGVKVGYVWECIPCRIATNIRTRARCSAAEAKVTELTEGLAEAEREREELLTDVREWLCEKCNYVYPGPPQPGVMAIICPRCGGTTLPMQAHYRKRADAAESRLAATERALERIEVAVRTRQYTNVIADQNVTEIVAALAALSDNRPED